MIDGWVEVSVDEAKALVVCGVDVHAVWDYNGELLISDWPMPSVEGVEAWWKDQDHPGKTLGFVIRAEGEDSGP